jgi:hypothetical protein
LGPAHLQGDQARLGSIAQTRRPSNPELSKPLADEPRTHGPQGNLIVVPLPQFGFEMGYFYPNWGYKWGTFTPIGVLIGIPVSRFGFYAGYLHPDWGSNWGNFPPMGVLTGAPLRWP